MYEEMNEFDWLEYVAAAERDIKKPPDTPKRRMPKVTRHQSTRQRTAESQTPNLTRAMYVPESKWNETPLAPEGFVGTRNVGPNDRHANVTWRTGKATGESTVGYNKVPPRTRGGRVSSKSLDELMSEYDE
jgi:hypothetical protein